jgi:hypothetical protein
VNAQTQQDGYPGYGGVFIESMFAFSKHPNGFAKAIEGSSEAFDDVFDAFRPDQSGQPVSAADFAGDGIPVLTSGDGCPAESGDRQMQVACAVWVFGSMVGTTMTHEIGHSLGLANPGSDGFHNIGARRAVRRGAVGVLRRRVRVPAADPAHRRAGDDDRAAGLLLDRPAADDHRGARGRSIAALGPGRRGAALVVHGAAAEEKWADRTDAGDARAEVAGLLVGGVVG